MPLDTFVLRNVSLEKYDECFIKTFDVKKDDLGEEFKFETVNNWDSLAHLNLIGEIEDSFGIILDTDDITHFGGYENGKMILKKYGIKI